MEDKETTVLLIDEELSPIIMEEQCEALKPVVEDFVECYVQNQDKPVEEWLGDKMQQSLPDKTPEEIQSMTDEILSNLEVIEEKKESLNKAIEKGISKESWFASETQKAVSGMTTHEAMGYLRNLDEAIKTANDALDCTIKTRAGIVSQNANLNGFIAEQYHAQTFNLNAEATGSPYRAKVLEPSGKGYSKNSVDVVIVDGNGKIVKRYQFKYYNSAKATENAFKGGNYRGQQSGVPADQQNEILRKSTTILEAPDGTTSNPLTYSESKRMQHDAQNGRPVELDWNEFKTKDLAKGIAKQAGIAALQGAVIGVGFDIAQKFVTGEDVKGEEIVETALVSGADNGVKAAAAGAIKVGAEKGFVSAALKETSAAAGVAHAAIEGVKILGKVASGELSGKEGIEKIEQTTVATVVGLESAAVGATIGETIGAVLGPIGSVIGGFVGGTISYMAGSTVGQTIVKGVQKVRDTAVGFLGKLALGAATVLDTVAGWIFG